MICVDANVLIAALDPNDLFHSSVSAALVDHDAIVALNVTWAEVLVHPHRVGQADTAYELLRDYGVIEHEVTNAIARTASALRAVHGNRDFPMLDALVVAAGIELSAEVVTTDAKWPSIDDCDVRLLTRDG